MKKLLVVFIGLLVAAAAVGGQSPGGGAEDGPGLGPTVAGPDFSGSWRPQQLVTESQTAAGDLADFGGIPLNDAARLYALSWPASRQTVKQHQCMGYVTPYFWYAPANYRIWEERDPYTQRLVAWRFYGQIAQGDRTVYMDGRPHPPAYAPHTFAGFSTGEYQGNTLTVTTTHLKRGWIKANGVPQSDAATVVEHFVRHGDTITLLAVIDDPVYLSEPLSKASLLVRMAKDPDAWLYPCDDSEQIYGRKGDVVPNHLFGQNPYVREYADRHNMPLLASLGGVETMYPELVSAVRDRAAAESTAKARMMPSGPPAVSRAPDPTPKDGEIHTMRVSGDVYLLAGDGANIAVQVGPQGAFVVDTGSGKLADKVIAAIARLSAKPIQFIVNTTFRTDHTGGNAKLQNAGADPSLTGTFFSMQFRGAGSAATIISQLNTQVHMLQYNLPTPPSDTFAEDRRRKYYNGEAVEAFPMPNATTDGDSIVHFRRADVIVAGDVFTTTEYPHIDIKNGGSVEGEIAALNFILDRTVYVHDEDGGTLIIPGHGRITDEWEVAEYRDMMVIIRDRVQALIKAGATLEQTLAARPTFDYDVRYGATSGPWTTNMFVEAVYTSLKNPPKIEDAR
ncbi:MAG TPA: MBL fold metallo-hydrolase [Terriglobia bacterium]|nr:MBL fold metallo-hydrolase [Terriglobia bacterium]